MTVLHNKIFINASIETIWNTLSDLEALELYDPTVKQSRAKTEAKHGLGAVRRVLMKDGKNWFEEVCRTSIPNTSLSYELTQCSFPIHRLQHSYTFEPAEQGVWVKQHMEYQVKFGILGRILDALMIRKQSDAGIKAFMKGLKTFTEKNTVPGT